MPRAKLSPRRWTRRLLLLLAPPLLLLALWIAIHRVSWLGPLLADTARAIVGTDAVAKLEDTAYAIEDRWNRYSRKNEQPEAYWDVPAEAPPAEIAPVALHVAAPSSAPIFRPKDVAPVHSSWSAPGDGTWVPVVDARNPDEAPRMYKTLLHPDRNRSWAAVSIVAADMRQVTLHLMAGRHEPKATEKDAAGYERSGVIPPEHHGQLLAAFNGGFKLEHGHYGIRVDKVTLVRPRAKMCTIGMTSDDTLAVGAWEGFEAEQNNLAWWRQTPPCMYDGGELHPGLRSDKNTAWGATLDGDTVIRRSAVGASEDGKTLYVGIGDFTTAPAIALAMHHAGAHGVAQLDVNWSYPKFLLFEPRDAGSSELVAKPLCKGFEFEDDEYVRKRNPRDFFYLTRRTDKDTVARD